MLNILLFLTISLLLCECIIVFEQDVALDSVVVVSSYPQLDQMWNQVKGVQIDGVVSEGTEKGRWGDILYWNVSNFFFIDLGGVDFLYAGGFEVALVLQERGALAFFIQDESKDPGRVFVFEKPNGDLVRPVGSIGRINWEAIRDLFSEGGEISFIIREIDDNQWVRILPALITLTIIMILLSFIPAAVSISTLSKFIFHSRTATLAIVCLSFNVFGDIGRIAGLILDPYFFYPFNLYAVSFLSAATISQCLLSSALLLICYWSEILQPISVKIKSFLSYLFWPFIVTDSVLWLYMITAEVLLFVRIDVQFVAILITAAFNLVLGILYFIVSYQVLESIEEQLSNVVKKKKLRSMSIKIIAAGIMMVSSVIVDILFGVLDIINIWDVPELNLFFFTLRYIQWGIISTTFSSIFDVQRGNTPSGSQHHSTKPSK